MIATLLAYFYITLISWTYGDFLLSTFTISAKTSISATLNFSIKCFGGFAIIGIFFTALSLFLPLGGILAQLILLVPCAIWWLLNKASLYQQLTDSRKIFYSVPPALLLLNFSCIVLILAMSSNQINHPDTLMYHAQNILWMEKYKAIPGLSNLYYNYGIQSSWFTLSALFSFSFTRTSALSFISPIVLIWFVMFITGRINDKLNERSGTNGLAILSWLLLLTISFWSFTQVRLTAVSASPDFIAAMLCWLVFFLFLLLREESSKFSSCLILLFSCFAISLKFSTLPIILLPLYHYYRIRNNRKPALFLLFPLIAFIFLLPILLRNFISSGYIFFPSTFPDLFSVDWKLSNSTMNINHDYIQAYARTGADHTPDSIQLARSMSISEWLPIWWNLRSWADKMILISIPLFLSLFFFLRKNKVLNAYYFFTILASTVGITFWFLQAPDPRFGFGFLIPFIALIFNLINEPQINISSSFIKIMMLVFTSVILSYSAYRLKNHFTLNSLIQPEGTAKSANHSIKCGDLVINVPENTNYCNSIPPPCTTGDCNAFESRGPKLEDGFRTKKSAER